MINAFYMQLQYLLIIMMKLIRVPSRISKNLLKCCERLNIENIEFPPKIKDVEQFQKNNSDISITIFEYDGFEKKWKRRNNN